METRLRAVEDARDSGTKVVGYLPGGYVPDELIYASGAIPLCLSHGGAARQAEEALSLVPNVICPFARAQIGEMLLKANPFYTTLTFTNPFNTAFHSAFPFDFAFTNSFSFANPFTLHITFPFAFTDSFTTAFLAAFTDGEVQPLDRNEFAVGLAQITCFDKHHAVVTQRKRKSATGFIIADLLIFGQHQGLLERISCVEQHLLVQIGPAHEVQDAVSFPQHGAAPRIALYGFDE